MGTTPATAGGETVTHVCGVPWMAALRSRENKSLFCVNATVSKPPNMYSVLPQLRKRCATRAAGAPLTATALQGPVGSEASM